MPFFGIFHFQKNKHWQWVFFSKDEFWKCWKLLNSESHRTFRRDFQIIIFFFQASLHVVYNLSGVKCITWASRLTGFSQVDSPLGYFQRMPHYVYVKPSSSFQKTLKNFMARKRYIQVQTLMFLSKVLKNER